jgi:GT2 family glycosyltransferase
MGSTVAIIVPTRGRPAYLDVALGSIAAQAAALGAEMVVVDDGPDPETHAVAARRGARYVAHDGPRGLNVARNTGIRATDADLLVYVDDDVEVWPGWLPALAEAAAACDDDVGVFTGPIRPRFEGRELRMCGREGPPITFFDAGPDDADVERAWGANMALRRSALERVGRFDIRLVNGGDEEEWQARWRASGGRIRYVAAAGVDHRRAGDDARLRSLARAAYGRGRAARRFDAFRGEAPALRSELRTLAGCAAHTLRYRCANGIVMAAHSAGRIREAPQIPSARRTETAARRANAEPDPFRADGPGDDPTQQTERNATSDDFLSGASGTVAGKRGALLAARDLAADAAQRVTGRRRRLARQAAARPPRRRVLVLGVERPDVPGLMRQAVVELQRSRHEVVIRTRPAGDKGKFENLNALLAGQPLAEFDWVLVVDDDVALPPRFLDVFLHVAEAAGLRLAQPAHRLHSHAAWEITRRRPGSDWRQTTFVEIGPVTAFHRDTFATLLPFPELRMGWGLDVHWSAVARNRGWRIGVVDATAVAHTLRPAADSYPRDEAIAEAREFLRHRPYVRRDEVRTLAAGSVGR